MKSLLVLWEFGRRRLAKESRHLILISRLKMMKNELWCLACWQKLVIRGRSLPRITQLSKFHQLSLLVRWMGAKGTLLSRVDQGFLDNWTSNWRFFIENRKSASSGGLCLPLEMGGMKFYQLSSGLVRWMWAKGTLASQVDQGPHWSHEATKIAILLQSCNAHCPFL